ncbi:M23 family metallopeptidase [Dysgonomonas sp. ZJ709]|uniref:M23 family metallopeptidase n=1 Tax=Dysgonomonas sp. ZJ709 TaxID=2709797 RepID=UPI0013E9E94C|nr:M23 family metallopeptidase [Dysgonomonas sp. ZJ709]
MKKILLSIALTFTLGANAQSQYRYPLDVPAILSANFGELRPNHFHSGIDLKTEGVVNKPVYSIMDGYVSRISVSPSGYGLALYIAHPNGQTSVYGHLNKYAPKIAEYIKERQYEQERYSIDITVDKNALPLKKGDLIAYSGNTGSSMGPHVHFEIRKSNTQEALDPLVFYKNQIKDTQKPIVKGIAVYPIYGKGVVNKKDIPFRRAITILKNGTYSPIKDSIYVWGTIGLGINSVDKMDGTTNIYGVKKVRLLCDNKEVFSSDISSFLFEQTRMINSLIDFDYWYNKKSFYMKSFIEPGNKLPIYKSVNSGYINIDKEKTYDMCYELEDLYGNKNTYKFTVIGKKQNIPAPKACSQAMMWNHNNHYITESFSLIIPKDYLYTDICFTLKETATSNYLSKQYVVNDSYVPLDGYSDMKIKLTNDSIANKSQYGIVRLVGAKEYWVGGTYTDGYMVTKVRELGNTYTVSFDNEAPTLTAVAPEKWVTRGKITMRASDNKSGISSYRGTIDGEFVLFEHDTKSPTYTYTFDSKRLKKGQTHAFVFTVTDACGNSKSYEQTF